MNRQLVLLPAPDGPAPRSARRRDVADGRTQGEINRRGADAARRALREATRRAAEREASRREARRLELLARLASPTLPGTPAA